MIPALALGLALAAVFAPPRPPETGPAAGPESALRFTPYVIKAGRGAEIAAELGWLTVPENRLRSSSRPIRLAMVRLRSVAAVPGPPLVYLAGGPGDSGIAAARGSSLELFLALREVGDVIALDQRGVGWSSPGLACRTTWQHPLDRVVEPEEYLREARQQARACAEVLTASGADLAGYTVRQSADDVEALRRALGVPQLNLLGVSFGTRLALEVLRRHPDSVARAVLAGVQGPEHALRLPGQVQERLAALGELVAADAVAGKAMPDLVGTLGILLERLARQPVSTRPPKHLSAGGGDLVIGRFDLQRIVVRALGTREEMSRLPAVLFAASRGDFSPVKLAVYKLRAGLLGPVVPYLMNCGSGVADARWEAIRGQEPRALLGRVMDFPFPEICEAWGEADGGAALRAPVASEVPVLLLSGSLDARTPWENAEEVRRTLSRSTHLVIAGGGHGDDLLLASPAIAAELVRHFRGQAPSSSRIVLPPLRFPGFEEEPLTRSATARRRAPR